MHDLGRIQGRTELLGPEKGLDVKFGASYAWAGSEGEVLNRTAYFVHGNTPVLGGG